MASNGLDCPLCDAVLYDLDNFQRHVETHRPPHDPVNEPRDRPCLQQAVSSVTEVRDPRDMPNQHGASTSESVAEQRAPRDPSPSRHACHLCSKVFTTMRNLKRHVQAEHEKRVHRCGTCRKTFKYPSNATRHEASCDGQRDHVCPECQKRCASAQGLRRHLQWHTRDRPQVIDPAERPTKRQNPDSADVQPKGHLPSASSAPNYRCRRCTACFVDRHALYLHSMREHYQVGGSLQRHPWGPPDQAPWQREDGTLDESLREIYDTNAPLILESHRRGPIQSVYNFPVTNEVSINDIIRHAEEIFRQQHHSFRLNLVFGVILRHRETGRYRFFIPYTNNWILERPLYVSRGVDLERLRRQLEQKDITTEILRNRPDTKWVPVLVTNVRFPVWSTHFPIRQGPLPAYLMKKSSLYPLVKNRHTGKAYDDQLCAFRCLALHRGHEIRCIDGPARAYYQNWMEGKEEDFDGLAYDQIPEFESFFGVNVEAYSLEEDKFARSVYKSRGQQQTTMNVNLYENHMSYIRDFAMFAQKYQCQTCDRHFKQPSDLHRHQKICSNKTKYVSPGGFHRAKENIFEQLDQYGIDVPTEDRIFPWFVCYDFEAVLQKVEDQPTEYLAWTQRHVPISVLLCSNVERHRDPVCLVDPDPDRLVLYKVSSLTEIADKVYELAEAKWGWVLEAIDTKIEEDGHQEDALFDEEDILEDDTADEESVEDDREAKTPSHPLQKVYGQLMNYMTQVPVLGFNSAKYDLNLIKRYLAKHLQMHEAPEMFVVKKDNAYACIATDQLKFLDMSQYLAAGSSYVGFLKAYRVTQQKGYFPYEWFDDVTKLEATEPHTRLSIAL